MKIGQSCRKKNNLTTCRCSFGDRRRQGQGKTQGQFEIQGQGQVESQRQEQKFTSSLTNFLLNLKLTIANFFKINSSKKINSNLNFIFFYNHSYRRKIKKRLDHYDLKPKRFLKHNLFWQRIFNS